MPDAQGPTTDILGSTARCLWRPWTLYTKSLVGFIILCLLLLIGNIIVIAGCADGCHVFGKSLDGALPLQSRFAYGQLPTILSVGLSLIWVIPHHDIMRLEPFFRMSTEDGEKAKTSLFLEYPYDIALIVPVKAIFNRHYIVAISASILFLMNFLIVPLLPNIFDTSVVTATFSGSAMQGSYDISGRNVPANITFSAYDYAWHSGILHPFMTETYALLPVIPDGYTFPTAENWTVETTLFEGELQCADAQAPEIGYVNNSLTVNITSVDGRHVVRICDAGAVEQGRSSVPNSDCETHMAFITPWASMSWQLGNATHPPVSYLYVWASGPSSPPEITDNSTFPPPIDITAIFCTPLYYSESVNATIGMPSGKVHSVTRSGRRSKIPTLSGFDAILDGGDGGRNFTGELLVKGVEESFQAPVRFGYPPEIVARVGTDLLTRFGRSSRPIQTGPLGRASPSNVFIIRTSTLSAFSLFDRTNETLGGLLDGRVLESTHERALKMFFAFAMSEALGSSPNKNPVSIERKVPTIRITTNRNWAFVGITGLSLTTTLAILLTILIRNRPCKLDGEPDSLAASLRLLSASPGMRAVMQWAEYYDPEELSKRMNAKNLLFKLDLVSVKGPVIRVMRGTGDEAEEVPGTAVLPDPGPNAKVWEEKGWAVMDILRVACLGCFPIVLVLLISSFAASRAHDGRSLVLGPLLCSLLIMVLSGFNLPGGPNTFRGKTLYTYFPTVLARVIEPILTTLGVTYCMMGPYTALETRKARYSKSLAVHYDKLPPQFQLHTSLKNREFTLLALSVAILLSTGLPIATVGLFSASPYTSKVPRSHNVLHNFTTIRQEMYFQAGKNLSSEYSTTWTTQDAYVDPPYEVTPHGRGVYDTLGFGIDISCTLTPESRIIFPCSPQYSKNRTDPACTKYSAWENILVIEDPCGIPERRVGGIWNGSCFDFIMRPKSCADRMFPIWAENKGYAVDPADRNDSYRFVVLNCSLLDRIVDLKATVNDGQVLSVTDVRPLGMPEVTRLYTTNTSATVPLSRSFVNILKDGILDEGSMTGSHTMARINSLMAVWNTSVVQEPRNETHVPDKQIAVGAFEVVLRRLFVALLRMSAEDIFGVNPDQATQYREEYRVRVNQTNFVVTVSIVVFLCVAIVALYVRRERQVMGHIPSTLAGVYSHLYASNVQEEIEEAGGDLKVVKQESKTLKRRYAYGEYPDGRHHGVYRVETGVQTGAEPKNQGVAVAVETVPV